MSLYPQCMLLLRIAALLVPLIAWDLPSALAGG